MTTSTVERMYIVFVRIQVLPENVDAFVAATRDNHLNSLKEPGCRRFDLLRAGDDPTRFALDEAYDDEAAFKAHQQTAHFFRWREAVAPLMAVPRVREGFHSVLPA